MTEALVRSHPEPQRTIPFLRKQWKGRPFRPSYRLCFKLVKVMRSDGSYTLFKINVPKAGFRSDDIKEFHFPKFIE